MKIFIVLMVLDYTKNYTTSMFLGASKVMGWVAC